MITLSSGGIKIILSDQGGLIGLIDRRINRNYIIGSGEAHRPLFRLSLSELENGQVLPGEVHQSSTLAEKISVETSLEEARITFSHIDGLDLHVQCVVRLDKKTSLSYWSIYVENNTSFALRAIEYPIIYAVTQLGDSMEDDRILLPKQDGYLLCNPLVLEWEGDFPRRRYDQRFQYPGEGREFPASLSAQLLAYYDADGGLYIATHDGNGHPKMLGPIWLDYDDKSVLDFTPVHQLQEQVGNDYDCPYETVIGYFQGDWRDAADLYKAWSMEQAWCSRKLCQRDDIPEWVKRGPFFFNFRLRGQEDGEDFLDGVPPYLEEWSRILDIPLVAMMCGWEKIGEWVGPDYFPPYGGAERFQSMCMRLRERNIHPFAFGLSGLKLPIRKRIGKDWPQPELAIDYDNREVFDKIYRQYAAINAEGCLITDSPIESWDGLHAYACVSTPQARRQLYDATLKLVGDYGVQVSQADQVFGGGTTECYHPAHSHPPGRGIWQVETLQKIYDDIRSDAKKIDPDFILSQEFQSELYMQHLDIFHGRVSDQPRGVLGVPLFAYLYHEYALCYGGDWSSMLRDNTCGVYNQAANFVYGSLPAGCPQTMTKMMRNCHPEECDPDILQMARNTCGLFKRFVRYLVFGQMKKSAPPQVAEVEVSFTGLNFSGWKKKTLAIPVILHCLWVSPEGQYAYALSNITNQQQEIWLGLEQRQANGFLLWVNDRPAVVIDGGEYPVFRVALPPLGAAILEIL